MKIQKDERSNLEKGYSDPGLNIYKTRSTLGWTQSALAKKVGVSTSMVSHWEKGTRTLTPEDALRVACALEVSLDFLLNAERWIPVFQLP